MIPSPLPSSSPGAPAPATGVAETTVVTTRTRPSDGRTTIVKTTVRRRPDGSAKAVMRETIEPPAAPGGRRGSGEDAIEQGRRTVETIGFPSPPPAGTMRRRTTHPLPDGHPMAEGGNDDDNDGPEIAPLEEPPPPIVHGAPRDQDENDGGGKTAQKAKKKRAARRPTHPLMPGAYRVANDVESEVRSGEEEAGITSTSKGFVPRGSEPMKAAIGGRPDVAVGGEEPSPLTSPSPITKKGGEKTITESPKTKQEQGVPLPPGPELAPSLADEDRLMMPLEYEYDTGRAGGRGLGGRGVHRVSADDDAKAGARREQEQEQGAPLPPGPELAPSLVDDDRLMMPSDYVARVDGNDTGAGRGGRGLGGRRVHPSSADDDAKTGARRTDTATAVPQQPMQPQLALDVRTGSTVSSPDASLSSSTAPARAVNQVGVDGRAQEQRQGDGESKEEEGEEPQPSSEPLQEVPLDAFVVETEEERLERRVRRLLLERETPPLLVEGTDVRVGGDAGGDAGGTKKASSSVDGKPLLQKRRKWGLILAALILTAAAVGVALGIVRPFQSDDGGPSEDPTSAPISPDCIDDGTCPSGAPTAFPSETPSATPTISSMPSVQPSSSPSAEPTSERYASFRTALVSAGADEEAWDAAESPQRRALEWLANEDGRNLYPAMDYVVNVTQRYALATLYFSTGGGDGAWMHNCSFLSEEHECQWFEEVPEDEFGYAYKGAGCLYSSWIVDDITIPMNNLSGTIPPEIDLLKDLHWIWVFGNSLRGGTPSSLCDLVEMRGIRLEQNELVGTIPFCLGILSKMQHLLLYENKLTGPIPSSLGGLENLQQLMLDSNGLTGQIPSSFASLSQLEFLSLSANKLIGSIPSWLGGLSSLWALQLQYNNLTGKIPSSLNNLTQMETLMLNDNKLTGQIPAWLGELTGLKTLVLGSNDLAGPIPSSLNNLTNLENLWLEDNVLNGTIPFIESFPFLRTLSLSYNGFTGTIPQSIFACENLEELYLAVNELNGTLSPQIGRLKNLREFYLAWNNMQGPLPTTIASPQQMEYLYLEGNFFTDNIPGEIIYLKQLLYLGLCTNMLTGTLPGGMGLMSSLEECWLHDNFLRGTVPQSLVMVDSLRTLTLHRNNFADDISFLCQNKSFSVLVADCHGHHPEVHCECCTACCSDEEWGDFLDGCFLN